MRRERIHATPSWRHEGPRYDCVFVETDPTRAGMRGLHAARVLLLFSFKRGGIAYPCALVQWFVTVGDSPDNDTGMWIVEPEIDARHRGQKMTSVIHIDTILRAAHLIGVYGRDFVPTGLHFSHSLDVFRQFYVNKFADHHANEIAF